MSHSILGTEDISTWKYIVTHVFCPLQLPDGNDHSIHNDHSLAVAITNAARLYFDHVDPTNLPQWQSILRMLENLLSITLSECLDESRIISLFSNMDVGDVSALLVRAQNAGVVFRKQRDVTIYESFELSPKAKNVMTAEGKLICSYPGPAIEIPNLVFDDKDFRSELVNFLVHMNNDDLDDVIIPCEEDEFSVGEERSSYKDASHPRYITNLLTGILRSVGRPVDIPRISKRVGDDVLCNDGSKLPWRRSSFWLLIRVALQTTLCRSPLGNDTYKKFILFFMCRIAKEEPCAELASDLLQFMAAKISRRLCKFGSSAPGWLSQTVLDTCTSLRSTIEDRWTLLQAAERQSPLWNPSQLNLIRDTQLSLLGSGTYIRNAVANHHSPPSDSPFNPFSYGCRTRGTLDDFLSSDGGFFEGAYHVEPHATLFDVEWAVEQGIDAWVDRVTNNEEACVKLEILAERYSSSASKTYTNNPELLSVMLLTTVELWVALDKIAIKEIPMLADYSPEVPTSFLEHLLLCKANGLHRLHKVYEYICRRHSQARRSRSIFSSEATADSFAVRFYRKSSHLRRLKAQIEEVARQEVREKIVELRKMNARYSQLQRSAGTRYNMDMWIGVHEWPLPASQLEAEVVVFELDCPVSFNMWRTATFHLLVNLRSSSVRQHDGSRIQLNNYQDLARYLPRSQTLNGSDTTSSSSRRNAHIPAKQEHVCIKNGWTFVVLDTHSGIPISRVLDRGDSGGYCTYRLQSGPFQDLQKFLNSTSHTSNEVIANQTDCHKDLSIREYMAFGHLRSGGLLQWLNILRELRARSLNFRLPEVHMLFAQAVSQVGPLANTGWMWHQEIEEPTFCHELLRGLDGLVRDIEANWKERVTMDTISFLLRRLLSSNVDQAVAREALSLLRTVRGKIFSWVHELSGMLASAPGSEEFCGVLRDTAAICRSTFDVDPALIPTLLHSAGNIEVLLSCTIIIHHHMPIDVFRLSTYSQLLLDRNRRLSLVLEGVACDFMQAESSDQGIHLAVGRIWPEYHPGSRWKMLQGPNSAFHWLSCSTAPPSDQRPQVVCLNICDGSLLVDGRPLGSHLPKEFIQHPQYKLLFGEQSIQVVPADLPGMDYCTRGLISGHQVYFSLRDNCPELIVRATRKGMPDCRSGIMELIPHGKLEGDFPAVLIEGHVHWLDLSTSVMEIRPLDCLWEESSENWMVDYTPGQHRMRKGHESLIDIRSQTWGMVSSRLRPLCAPQDLVISISLVDTSILASSLQLLVFLPRCDLSFFVDEDGDLQSHNMRGKVCDENQSIGTLFGLVNRLVLRPKSKDIDGLELNPRCVLIPEGDISYRMDGHHVCVEITPHPSRKKRVAYQTYKVDTILGCLAGNAGLTSSLYCAYLHALTSGCSIDPLTGRSGTEEALLILRSANCWSAIRLCPHDVELLSLIASICPSRTWNPEQSAQTVVWRNLPPNAQYYELFVVTKAIKEHYERFQVVYENPSSLLFTGFPLQDDHLLRRSARQAIYTYPIGSTWQQTGANSDARYCGRDVIKAASAEHDRVYTAATCVFLRTATSAMDIWRMVELWQEKPGHTVLSLRYGRPWLTPDPLSIWFKVYNLLRGGDDTKWFQLLFTLPAMAYVSSNLSELVPVFVAFASHSEFRFEDPPHYNSYLIAQGYCPSMLAMRRFIWDCAYCFNGSADEAVAQSFLQTCPWETFPPLDPELYDLAALEPKLLRHFFDRRHNFILVDHLARVQTILIQLHSRSSRIRDTITIPYSFHPSQSIPSCVPWRMTMDQLFIRPALSLQSHDKLPRYAADIRNTPSPDAAALHDLIATVRMHAINQFQHQYMSALQLSARSIRNEVPLVDQGVTGYPTAAALVEHYIRCRTSYVKTLSQFQRHLGPSSPMEEAVQQAGQWPRITANTLFRFLASNSPTILPGDWKGCLITFTLLALELQRARRLLLLDLDDKRDELWKELQNEGCDGWDAEAHPDWLLIQLQGNFLIRRVQAEVANEMISPSSGENTAMQLNMGEGKTSVIVPIVVSTLANANQLVRVIVPKPLMAQTLHLLVDRLGRLTNRRIYYLPFSRSLQVNDQELASFRAIMFECMQERGILVAEPDHILSLKLVSVEKQLFAEEDGQLAHQFLELRQWLHARARDILDESDEILDVRSELIFTIGRQQHVQGSPERWTITEQVLNLIRKHAAPLRELFPLRVEYESGPPGSFPYLRILHPDAEARLISWIVEDVIDGHLPDVSFRHLRIHLGLGDAIRRFISQQDVSSTKVRLVKDCLGNTSLWGGLLLLRGLLATGILLFPFVERRWRVDYGLAPTRTMLAVPYRAKDVPAKKAEFGHPDIAIILTCLSYYYAGLTEEQLKASFGTLFKQHDPSVHYDVWLRLCPTIPKSLQNLSGVNIESVEQWNTFLFPLFSRNQATVDFYLSNVVFPREAKEFPSKLSSSGWDLAEKKELPLTGFSGTNDGQHLFPIHITQRDPDHQRGTNAMVLSYLLLPENNHYMCMTLENCGRWTTHEFLKILVAQKPEIRVLLDVGAQMLDLENHQLAKAWLDNFSEAFAAIYFNQEDELMVVTRDGSTQPLSSSPYAEQLDRCVVYLDDAHTRGTDIKFPLGYRAAVTLGPKVTKDRLIQGCMRMRKLGHGHSLMFFAPLAVDRHIRAITGKDKNRLVAVDTADILHWAIQETWENIQRWAPHWIQQGIDHASRYTAWTSFSKGQLTLKELSGKWLQPEAKSMEDLYEPRDLRSNPAIQTSLDIRQRCIDLGVLSLWSIGMDEEQEREVVYEVIRERQVERPSRVLPANHSIHQDVIDFVKSGVIRTQTNFSGAQIQPFSPAFIPAFKTLDSTSAANNEAFIWGQSVLVTADFKRTVKVSETMDDYLRPVHWIVSAKRASGDLFIILSPYEANALLPDIRSSNKVHLHLYTPRITKKMKLCDDLGLYSIPAVPDGWITPSSLMDQLNVFAGQLYLKDYETYIRLCRFLWVYARDLEGTEGNIVVEPDGFILPKNRKGLVRLRPEMGHTFAFTPLVAIKALMNLRGKGIDVSSTHMGKIIHGRLLSEDDFDDGGHNTGDVE